MNKKLIILLSGLISIGIYMFLPVDKNVLKGLSILLFIAALWITEALPITVTALLVPIVAVMTGIFNVKDALSHFAHPIIFLFLGGFGLAAALHKYNLDELFAGYIMKAAGTRMIFSVISLFAATALMSMWISNTATTAIMLPVALGLISKLKEKNYTTEVFILLGVAYSANIGGIGTVIGSPPNAITAANLGLSFSEWLAIGIPFMLILLPIMVIVLYVKLKPKFPEMTAIYAIKAQDVFCNKKSYIVTVIFGFTIILWLLSKPISSWLGIEKGFDSIIAVFAIVLLVLFRTMKWKEIENFADWGVLLLFGGGLALSGVLSETGASEYLAVLVETHLSHYGPFLLLLGAVTLMIFLTEVASNTASAAILVPIFLVLGEQIGHFSSDVLALTVGIAASCAFMLPVATPPNALVFGTERIKLRTMMRVGFVLNIIFALVISILAYLIL
ncbi:MAG: SLC13/DASS family transporter [Deltaproteobacteria bacterium]|nr:SLC13/DASS family transporter [Deltaproteobacteria bacterium]